MLRDVADVRNFSSFAALAGRFSNKMGATTPCMGGEWNVFLAFTIGLIPWERWRSEVRHFDLEFKGLYIQQYKRLNFVSFSATMSLPS